MADNISCVCVCMYVCTHHIFIHSSVGGHLGYFYVLGIINSAAVNIGVHVSFRIEFSPDNMPRSGIADHVVTLFLVF